MIVIRETCVPPKTGLHSKHLPYRGAMRLVDSKPLKEAKAQYDVLFLPHRPPRPLEGPLVLDVELRWPHTKGTPKRDVGKEAPMDVKPDASNCLKMVEDALARCGFFTNDSQIVDARVRKLRSPSPGIVVRLGVIGEDF